MVDVCKTIADYSSSNGAMPLLYSVRDCVPYAFPSLLFTIFLVLFAGQYYLIKNRTGRAKILIAILSSSFVTTVLSTILALTQLIKYQVVLFYTFILIMSFIAFKLSDES
jgi:hypothetical protein